MSVAPDQHLRDAALIALAQARDQVGFANEQLEIVNERDAELPGNTRAVPLDSGLLPVTPRLGSAWGKLSLWSLVGLIALLPLGAVVFAWQSFHLQVQPTPGSNSSASKELAAKPASAGAGAPRISPQAQTTGQHAAPEVPATASPVPDLAQSMAAMAHHLAEAEQVIDKLKAGQAHTVSENAELDKHLKEIQEMARRNADLVDDLRVAQTQMAHDNSNIAEQLRVNQGQLEHRCTIRCQPKKKWLRSQRSSKKQPKNNIAA